MFYEGSAPNRAPELLEALNRALEAQSRARIERFRREVLRFCVSCYMLYYKSERFRREVLQTDSGQKLLTVSGRRFDCENTVFLT